MCVYVCVCSVCGCVSYVVWGFLCLRGFVCLKVGVYESVPCVGVVF